MTEPLLLLERAAVGPLDRAMHDSLAAALAKAGGLSGFNAPGVTVLRYKLSFYRDVDLIEIAAQDATPQDARLYGLHHAGRFHWLNGSSQPIHETNALTDLIITQSTALDYLAFFCFFIRGEGGPFLIVDRLDNRYLPKLAEAEALGAAFRPPVLHGQDENGDWRASSLIFYGESIFFADFLIHLDGLIEMKRDQGLIENTGRTVHAPLVDPGKKP